jgi:hypothetical protein
VHIKGRLLVAGVVAAAVLVMSAPAAVVAAEPQTDGADKTVALFDPHRVTNGIDLFDPHAITNIVDLLDPRGAVA